MRIHVTKLSSQEQVFGSLNIGKLARTNLVTIKGHPVFRNEEGVLVYCSEEMLARIEERFAVKELSEAYEHAKIC